MRSLRKSNVFVAVLFVAATAVLAQEALCACCGRKLLPLSMMKRGRKYCSPACRKMHWKLRNGYPRYTGPNGDFYNGQKK